MLLRLEVKLVQSILLLAILSDGKKVASFYLRRLVNFLLQACIIDILLSIILTV